MDAIYKEEQNIAEFGDIIKEIRSLLQNHSNYSVHAIRRQENETTYVLARHSRSLSCLNFFQSVPNFLVTCINDVCHSCYSNETTGSLPSGDAAKAS